MSKHLVFLPLLVTFTIAYFEFTMTYFTDPYGKLFILKSDEEVNFNAYVNDSSSPAQVEKSNNDNSFYINCEPSKPLKLKIIIETHLTSLKEMFSHQDIVSIKLKSSGENVKSLESLFYICLSLKSVDFTEFDLSQVTNVKYMFSCCEFLNNINFGSSNILHLENMEGMFDHCKSLKFLDLSNFDTSKTTTMNSLFYYCNSLTSLNLTNFDTKSVEDFGSMFENCKLLTSLDLSHFETQNAKNMTRMFYGCKSITFLDLNNFNTSLVESTKGMFETCLALQTLKIDNFDTSLVTDMSYMFSDCNFLTSLNISKFSGRNVKRVSYMFKYCYFLTSLDFSNFNPAQIINMDGMFYNCFNLKSLNLSSFITSSTTSMDSMFYWCRSLSYLNINNFNTSNVTYMNNMFAGCISLISLNLSNFILKDDSNYMNMLSQVSKNLIICANDDFYDKIKFQLNEGGCIVRDNNCFPDWSIKSFKIISESNECVENCNITQNYKYEYESKCYSKCPKGTTSIYNNNFLCELFDQEKFLENEKNIINNTVNIDYTSESIIERENEITNEYEESTKELIETKSEESIIDNSKEIIEDNIQTNNVIIEGEDNFIKICRPYNFFIKECNPIKYNSNMIDMIKHDIKEHLMDNMLEEVINESKIDINNIDNNIKYQITSSFNQRNKIYNNISNIDLKECEAKLKEVYHINPNDTLIIFKYDYKIEGLLIPMVGYEVFHPITKEVLDLNHCKNNKIDVIIPVNIDQNKLYKHDPNNTYYKDKCNSYPNEKGVDMTLYDRKKEFNDKNLSLCAENCEFMDYNNETKKAICQCEPQFNSSLLTLEKIINKEKLLNNFLDIEKTTNIGVIKCYKKLLSFKGIKNNIGSYIILSISFIFFICTITFIVKGYKTLSEKIQKILRMNSQNKQLTLNKKRKNKKENEELKLVINKEEKKQKRKSTNLLNSNSSKQKTNLRKRNTLNLLNKKENNRYKNKI